MILTEISFFSMRNENEKVFYVEGKRGEVPLKFEYKESFLEKTFRKASKKKRDHNLSYAKEIGLNIKGVFSVPAYTSQLKITFSTGDIREYIIRKENLRERIALCIQEQPSDDAYTTSPVLTRPIFKTIRKWVVSVICIYLRAKYGSQKNNVLFAVPSPHRTGHGLANFDVAAHEISSGFFGKKPEQIFAFYPNSSPVANQPSVQYPKPYYLSIFESGFTQSANTQVRFIFGSPFYYSALCRLFRKTGGRIYPMRKYGHRDIFSCIKKRRPSYVLTNDIRDKGIRFCKNLNIDINRPTVIFANREPGGIVTNDQIAEIKRYGFRNTSVNNLIPTIKYLAGDYNVIRIGKSNKRLEINVRYFYDLSTIPESPAKTELDFYFASLCSFFIGTTSGIFAISQIMRKPIIWTNTVPIGHYSCWSDWDISLFKLMKEKKTGKLVTFKKALQSIEGWGQHAEMFSGHYQFIENTGDEILEATKEMQKQLRNSCPNKKTSLNKKLISYYPNNTELYIKHRGTVSDYFLKKHQKLLE